MFASTRAAELAALPWSDEQRTVFCDAQFDAQDRYYRQQFPDSTYDVVLQDGLEVGRLYVDRTGDEIVLLDIALLPERQGRGLGGALLRNLLAEAAGSDRPVLLHVERANPARRLYERLGFVEVEQGSVYDSLRWSAGSGEGSLVVAAVRTGRDRDEEDRELPQNVMREQQSSLLEDGRAAEQQRERTALAAGAPEVHDRHQLERDLARPEELTGQRPKGLGSKGVHGARSLTLQDRKSPPSKGSTMDCTRRTALQLSMVSATVTAMSVSGLAEAAAARRDTPTRLERSTFTPLVGSTFMVGTAKARLSAVRDLSSASAGSSTRFSLLFTSTQALASATYAVTHTTLQSFSLYLGQVGPVAGSYEAVVNN